jgi:hypothetical protein
MIRMSLVVLMSMISTAALAQSRSVYVSTGSSVYVSSGGRSTYVTAAPLTFRNSNTRTNFGADGSLAGNRFINSARFSFFADPFPSVYMWNQSWLGRPVIDTGPIGRPEIDTGFLGRPGIDTGVGISPPISPRTLHSMNPRAPRGPAFSGRTTATPRSSGAAKPGNIRFGTGK